MNYFLNIFFVLNKIGLDFDFNELIEFFFGVLRLELNQSYERKLLKGLMDFGKCC